MKNAMDGLSKNQRRMLEVLYLDAINGGAGPGYSGYSYWATIGTTTQRASWSRALRRLEQRGILLRVNFSNGMGEQYGYRMRKSKDEPHSRTTHIKLTDAGMEIGKRLTKTKNSDVNRSGGDE